MAERDDDGVPPEVASFFELLRTSGASLEVLESAETVKRNLRAGATTIDPKGRHRRRHPNHA